MIESIGWIANVLFVSAYLLVSQGKISGDGKPFNFMNLAGAILYGIYAVSKEAWPVLVLEFFWGGIAAVALWKYYKYIKSAKNTTNEKSGGKEEV